MRRVFLALCLIVTFTIVELPSQATASYVTLILRNIATNDFDEWNVKSSQQCTQTTGKIRQDSEDFEETWYVGQVGSEIRFWWSRLSGEADATVLVNNVVVFKGRCMHAGNGTVRMIDTCAYPPKQIRCRRLQLPFGTSSDWSDSGVAVHRCES